MEQGSGVSFIVAVGAGAASFLSACVLPLIPTYVTYLAGGSVERLRGAGATSLRAKTMVNALAFVAGFSMVFVTMGLTASAVGVLLSRHQPLLRRVAGAAIAAMGLHLMGVLRIPALHREARVPLVPRAPGLWGSLLLGVAFSAGWTPCVGPVLGSILLYAATASSATTGALLLAAYSAGLAVPFLAAAGVVAFFSPAVARWGAAGARVTVASGALMVVAGVLLYFNLLARLPGLVRWPF